MTITNTENERGYRISSTRGNEVLNCFGVVSRCKTMTTDIRVKFFSPSSSSLSLHFLKEIIGRRIRRKYGLDFVVVTN
jgi:hypothetical protein